ncbi:MAG: TIGR03013 family XrtA/PEP-CTERM system glycosyltransferase [Burkholderiaceae bacterium]
MFGTFHQRQVLAAALQLLGVGLLSFVVVWLAVASDFVRLAQSEALPTTTGSLGLYAISFAALIAAASGGAGLFRSSQGVTVWASFKWAAVVVAFASVPAAFVFWLWLERGYILRPLMMTMTLLLLALWLVRLMSSWVKASGLTARRVMVLGTGKQAEAVVAELHKFDPTGYFVVGYFPVGTGSEAGDIDQKLILDPTVSMAVHAQRLRVDEVIVAVKEQRGVGLPLQDLLACRTQGRSVLDLSRFYERVHGEVPIESLKASWLIYSEGFVQGAVRTISKRIFDVLASLALLALTWPVIVVTAMLIKLESRGPVLYRQERVGLSGRSFQVLKLRSMCSDAERDGVARWATSNDSRVTRVGRVIRKTRIDELPQLFNVLKGEMSFVGPRPERPVFVQKLSEDLAFYDVRHTVKPGITGWAQVRFSYASTLDEAKKKLHYDLYYVKNHSLFLDVVILFQTIRVILFQVGAR